MVKSKIENYFLGFLTHQKIESHDQAHPILQPIPADPDPH